jgi:hypothetical protein
VGSHLVAEVLELDMKRKGGEERREGWELLWG